VDRATSCLGRWLVTGCTVMPIRRQHGNCASPSASPRPTAKACVLR